MSHERAHMTVMVSLALAVLVGAAVLMQVEPPATSATESAPALEMARADAVPAATRGQQADPVEPNAACKVRPECSTDADCDIRCGAGQGKCVHSSCPVRVCHCN